MSSRPTKEEQCELQRLMAGIQAVLDGADTTAALAALNFCMGMIIRDCYDGDEGALRLSDEQTRFVARELRAGEERKN